MAKITELGEGITLKNILKKLIKECKTVNLAESEDIYINRAIEKIVVRLRNNLPPKKPIHGIMGEGDNKRICDCTLCYDANTFNSNLYKLEDAVENIK